MNTPAIERLEAISQGDTLGALIPFNRRIEQLESMIDGRITTVRLYRVLMLVRDLLGDGCHTYLEIGVHNGGSMSAAMQDPHPCHFYGVDLFRPSLQYLKDRLSIDRTRQNIQRCNLHEHPVSLIKGNSTSTGIITTVKRLCPSVDVLLVDGDHRFVGVRRDFLNYGPLVRKGGLLIFDDYTPKWKGVVKFVDSIESDEWRRIGAIDGRYLFCRIKEPARQPSPRRRFGPRRSSLSKAA